MPPKQKKKPPPATRLSRSTVGSCLAAVGIADPASAFADCATLADEFKVVKKRWHTTVLQAHPDKGGDRETFELVQDAFQTLRLMITEGKIGSFADAKTTQKSAQKEFTEASKHRPTTTPSWEHYFGASTEGFPIYTVELAKTGRSGCEQRKRVGTTKCPLWTSAKTYDQSTVDERKKCPCFIPKGEVRVGSLDLVSGSYARYVHLACWRVPSKVHSGLPDPDKEFSLDAFKQALLAMDEVLLKGMISLPERDLDAMARHVMDKKHWTPKRKEDLLPPGAAAAEPIAGKAAKGAKAKMGRLPPAPVPAPAAKRAKTNNGTNAAATATNAIDLIDATSDNDMDEDDVPIARMGNTNVVSVVGKKTKGIKANQPEFGTLGDLGSPVPQPLAAASKPVGPKKESTAMVMPRPGVGLAVPSALLGKTVVLTGLFPELGGGYGLNQGKDEARALVVSFGGRVTGSVSGKTDFLLTGVAPGYRKVEQARLKGATLVNLKQFTQLLGSGLGVPEKGTADAGRITEHVGIASFSAGYFKQGGPNGIALTASAAELEFAATGAAQVGIYPGQGASAKRPPKPKPNKTKALGYLD